MVVTTFAEAREQRRGVVGLVPTMGYLHEGHTSLIERAAAECDTVIVSLFVNPLQFDDPSDLERYPHDRERDESIAAAFGGDVLFAPPPEQVYPPGEATRVSVRGVSDVLEGEHRPGHFQGVATVVTKLLAGVQPNRAYFGRKDAQQLAMVRLLARDLAMPVVIEGCRTVREEDGLALSSRNVRLAPEEREAALTLSRGLMAAADAVDDGEKDAAVLAGLAMETMEADDRVTPEYAAVASQLDAEVLDVVDRPAFLAVAARVGEVRLIDNVHIDPLPPGTDGWLAPSGPVSFAADRGIRLDRPSIVYQGGD